MLITTKELDIAKLQDGEEEEEGLGLDESLEEKAPEEDSEEELGGFGEEEKI